MNFGQGSKVRHKDFALPPPKLHMKSQCVISSSHQWKWMLCFWWKYNKHENFCSDVVVSISTQPEPRKQKRVNSSLQLENTKNLHTILVFSSTILHFLLTWHQMHLLAFGQMYTPPPHIVSFDEGESGCVCVFTLEPRAPRIWLCWELKWYWKERNSGEERNSPPLPLLSSTI